MSQIQTKITQSDERSESNISEPKNAIERVAQEIEKIIPDAKTTIHSISIWDRHKQMDVISNEDAIIEIVRNGVHSCVKVRPTRNGDGVKVTHGGDPSEDKGAKVVGSVDGTIHWSHVSINKKAIDEISSKSSDWDHEQINNRHAEKVTDEHVKKHPSIRVTGIKRIIKPHGSPDTEQGIKIGIVAEIRVPQNVESWNNIKARNPNHSIPSGKVVIGIVASTPNVDVECVDGAIRVSGSVDDIIPIINRINGNPITDW